MIKYIKSYYSIIYSRRKNRYLIAFFIFINSFFIYCGKLNCSTILLNRDEIVKIDMLIQLNVSIVKAVQRISRSRERARWKNESMMARYNYIHIEHTAASRGQHGCRWDGCQAQIMRPLEKSAWEITVGAWWWNASWYHSNNQQGSSRVTMPTEKDRTSWEKRHGGVPAQR